MNYLDVYFSRVNHLGETTAERIRNGGIRSFQKWMEESPHTLRNLSVERGLYFDGIILTNKDKEYQKIMFLNVANDIPLVIGDIMNWRLDDGSIEKWLIFQEEKKVNGTYRTFWIIRCNYLLKWIDKLGHLQQSWSYLVSSLDNKIKGNFRTWNSLITPQPNKYAEVLMPRYPIDRATNFIVEEESWNVVEYDHTSVPGVIYLSMTENKINLIYDDLKNNIADTDKLAHYELSSPAEIQNFAVGQQIKPVFTLTKNGIPYDAETTLITQDKKIARLIDGVLTAVGEGETTIIVQLVDFPDITTTIDIKVNDEEVIFSAYIEGSDKIRLDRDSTYYLIGTAEIDEPVIFTLDSEFATIVNVEDNKCILHANDKNLLGDFILSAEYKGITYTKALTVIPLW